MRLSLITLSLALLLLLMHLLLFRFLPGSSVIDLPFLNRFDLPPLFVAPPPGALPARTPPPTSTTTSTGVSPGGGFTGPTGTPHVNGPSGPPPNY